MMNSTASWANNSLSKDCPAPDQVQQQKVSEVADISWSTKEVGFVLGSIYCGCLISRFFGKNLAESFHCKRVLGISMAIASFLTLLSPVSAEWNVYALMLLRILLGLALGPFVAAQSLMIGQWIPTRERSFHGIFIFSGLLVSSVLSPIFSAFLCDSPSAGGWPSAFYVPGLAGGIWCVFWFYLIHETPLQHPQISADELQHILSSIIRNAINKRPATSWKKVIKSIYFWAHLAGYFAVAWNAGFFETIQPLYLGKVLHLPIVKIGLISALPNTVRMVVQLFCSCPTISDWRKMCTSITVVRKAWIFAGATIALMSFLGVSLVGCSQTFAPLFLALSFLFNGMVASEARTLSLHLTPTLSDSVTDVLESASMTSMFIIPVILGSFTESQQNVSSWSKIFYVNMAVIGTGSLLFIVFGSFGEEHRRETDHQGRRSRGIEGGVSNPEAVDREEGYRERNVS